MFISKPNGIAYRKSFTSPDKWNVWKLKERKYMMIKVKALITDLDQGLAYRIKRAGQHFRCKNTITAVFEVVSFYAQLTRTIWGQSEAHINFVPKFKTGKHLEHFDVHLLVFEVLELTKRY